ncbi:MAG TPA: hypothetical protein VGC65_09780 [Bacteroidia bacterium]|jgi:hypothetical protein
MDTLIKSNQKNGFSASAKKTETKTQTAAQIDFWKKAEFNRLGITPILLLVMSCMGGFAAASGILESWVRLAAVAFPATISLAIILAVAPMRVIFISTAIAIIMDLLVIIL